MSCVELRELRDPGILFLSNYKFQCYLEMKITWLPNYVPRLVQQMSQLADRMVDMFWGSVGQQRGKLQEAERSEERSQRVKKIGKHGKGTKSRNSALQ